MSDNLFVPSAAITAGALPELGVCAPHGEVATSSKDCTFYGRTPVWIYVLCVLSLWVGFIVHVISRKRVAGAVPQCADCIRQQSARRRNIVIAWVAALGMVFASVAFQPEDGVWVLGSIVAFLAFLAVIAALIYTVLAKRDVQTGYVTRDRQWVEMMNVAPAFSALVRDKIGGSAEAVAQRPG